MRTQNLYAIRDTLAQSIIGGVYLMAHDAVAVRFFGDAASDAQSPIAKHLDDYELICLGTIQDDGRIMDHGQLPEVVITGTAWKAAQAKGPELAREA